MPRPHGAKIYLSLLLCLLAIVVILSVRFFKPLLDWLSSGLLYPLAHFSWARGSTNLQNIPELQNALTVCQSKATNNVVDATELQRLRQENTKLREQLNFKPTKPLTTVGAEIISRDIDTLHEVVLVNRGTQDHIAINQPVITGTGILVGKVIKVGSAVAWVRLLSDGQSAGGATVVNDSASAGVVEGGYGLSLRLRFIPRDEVVAVGERVVTSGLEPGVPAGLLIGTIAVVQNEAYQPFQEAILTPLAEFSKLRLLSVITAF